MNHYGSSNTGTRLSKILILLFFSALSASKGAGIAAIKEQPFHSDNLAKPFVYAKILSSTPISVSFDLGQKQIALERVKVVALVDVPELPQNIRNESELADIHKVYDGIKSFANRYVQCAPLLQPYIENFKRSIERFNDGEVRYNSVWLSKQEYAAILKRQKDEAELVRRQEMARYEKMKEQREKDEAFAKSQRDKGFELYNNQWLPRNEVLTLQRRDREEINIREKIHSKSIFGAVYSIFQVLDKGMLIKPRRGKVENKGINVSIAYLAGALESAAAEGDYYKGDLYWYGNYSYRTKGGDDVTVNAYCLDRDDAVSKVRRTLYGNGNASSGNIVTEGVNNEKNIDTPEQLNGAKSTGSGFFVGNNGYFITNAHVISEAGASQIFIYHGGNNHHAELVAVSKVADLAILKTAIKSIGIEISTEDPQLGDDIFAIGYPQPLIQGLEAKITKGVVSSTKGLNDDDTRFQIDAAVQPGNSGGPLCDTEGRLVGVVVAGLNQIAIANITGSIPQNVNYGIKANEVLALLRTKSIDASIFIKSEKESANKTSIIKTVSDKTGLVIVK